MYVSQSDLESIAISDLQYPPNAHHVVTKYSLLYCCETSVETTLLI